MSWTHMFRILTVDDSVMDEQFVLTPPEEEVSTTGTEMKHEEEGKDRKPVHRGQGHLRLVSEVIRLRDRHLAVDYAAHAEVPDFSIQGRARANDQRERAEASGDAETSQQDSYVTPIFCYKEVQPTLLRTLRERAQRAGSKKGEVPWKGSIPKRIQMDLTSNRRLLQRIFHAPLNADIVIRDFQVGGPHRVNAIAVFIDGIADKTIINTHILEPLMLLSGLESAANSQKLMSWVKDALLPGNQVMEFATWKEATEGILAGSTIVFLDGVNRILSVETKGWEHRMVGVATTESVVRGPHDGFTESFRANTGLVRAKLRSTRLITEMMQVGNLASTDVAIMYMEGVVNPKIVREVKKRIKAIQVDYLPDSGLLEQFLADNPRALIPEMLSTERPDRVAFGLSEGQVAIFLGHSPFVILAPTVFWSLLQTSEDAYLMWPFGSFIRLIRILSLGIGLFLPAFYIAITNYHPEMIPTDLMLAIAASRERVPFPVVAEVLVMEFSIELIREAGIRIPTIIGPTIGIVGALILGQAAVAAGIISPLLIIVVAVTALASFTMPNYNLSFSIRLLRFGFILAAATFGFYGLALLLMVFLMHMVTMRSFGVPVMSPIAPRRDSSPDTVLRAPAYTMETRPGAYFPARKRRQADVTRGWDADVRDSREARRARQNPKKS